MYSAPPFRNTSCTAFSCREYRPSRQFLHSDLFKKTLLTYRTTGPVAIDTGGHAVHAIPAPAVTQITGSVYALDCSSDSHQSARYSESTAAACRQGERNDDTGLFGLSTMSIPITAEAVFIVAGE